MASRCAAPVVAIDPDHPDLPQAKFAGEVNDLHIEFHQLSVYDIARLSERSSVVLFLGPNRACFEAMFYMCHRAGKEN
jgi:tRNA (mo5U34)-methyltransferase